MASLATKTSAMFPGTVTSSPRPIDRTMLWAGRTTVCAVAVLAGTMASGAMARLAISAVAVRRRFMILPLGL